MNEKKLVENLHSNIIGIINLYGLNREAEQTELFVLLNRHILTIMNSKMFKGKLMKKSFFINNLFYCILFQMNYHF